MKMENRIKAMNDVTIINGIARYYHCNFKRFMHNGKSALFFSRGQLSSIIVPVEVLIEIFECRDAGIERKMPEVRGEHCTPSSECLIEESLVIDDFVHEISF